MGYLRFGKEGLLLYEEGYTRNSNEREEGGRFGLKNADVTSAKNKYKNNTGHIV
jgi:hypothetical protein